MMRPCYRARTGRMTRKNHERDLLCLVADGRFHSGEELAGKLGISRTAVWKHLQKAGKKGMEIIAIRGKGYCLSAPLELLEAQRIQEHLDCRVRQSMQELRVYYETGSTNRILEQELEAGGQIHGRCILAEHQTQGKGRSGNRWLTVPASGLCLSVGWHFPSLPGSFAALSLATGVVLAKSLRQLGVQGIQLKWPNDLIYSHAKLGGILIESRGQLSGPVDVVIGVGINNRLSPDITLKIEQEVTDLFSILGYQPSRNRLAGILINNIFALLDGYPREGFHSRIEDWRALDCTRGRKAILRLPGKEVSGRVIDIDEEGNLIISVRGKRKKFSSGDLSLKVMH